MVVLVFLKIKHAEVSFKDPKKGPEEVCHVFTLTLVCIYKHICDSAWCFVNDSYLGINSTYFSLLSYNVTM